MLSLTAIGMACSQTAIPRLLFFAASVINRVNFFFVFGHGSSHPPMPQRRPTQPSRVLSCLTFRFGHLDSAPSIQRSYLPHERGI